MSDNCEEQARLHEVDAAAIAEQILALRRRAEAIRQLASAKRDEAEMERERTLAQAATARQKIGLQPDLHR